MDVDHSGTDSTPKASTSRSKALASLNPGPTSLHDVVLDYISHIACHETAQKLASTKRNTGNGTGKGDVEMGEEVESSSRPSRGVSRAGYDEEALQSIERRYNIINHILNGAIVKAIEALNTHYPAVLSLPDPNSASTVGSGSNGQTASSSNGHRSNGAPMTSKAHGTTSNFPTPTLHLMSNGNSKTYAENGDLIIGRAIFAPTNVNDNVNPTTTSEPTNHATPTFPESLYPPHVLLNLQIQDFIESFRLLNPDPSPSSSMTSSITSLHASQSLSISLGLGNGNGNPNGLGTTNGCTNGTGSLQQALSAAGRLHAEAKKLEPIDRAVYVREITEAGALFAYTDPESSPVGGFLEQERRIQLAQQVNRAILNSQGEPTQSLLERFARRTIATYNILDQRNIDSKPPWSGIEGSERQQLAKWWKTHNKKFKLADFVAQGYN